MMHDHEKSDPAIVAGKPANKVASATAESMEPRAGTKGNASQQSTLRAQDRESVSQALERVRQAARQRKKEKFTSLLHHINVASLRMAFFALKRDAAPGVDGVTWQTYEADLDRNLTDLHDRVHRGAYRAQPSRRTYIPKADGRQRPLAVAALEDKIVQRATAAVLNCNLRGGLPRVQLRVPAQDAASTMRWTRSASGSPPSGELHSRRGRSILFRRSQPILAGPLRRASDRRPTHHPPDPEMAEGGRLEDGVVTTSDKGTGQGSVISPLLANVYLHYVFDLWADRWRRREATGDMVIVRYADDIVVGFEHEIDARRFWDAMQKRFEEFALSLHPDKTRLIEFGRHAADRRARRGLGKPETFNFLGFTFICGRSRTGKFLLKTEIPAGSHADEAQGDQGGAAAAHAPADPRAGEMAGASREGLLRVSCRADQLPGTQRVPPPCQAPLDAHAAASQPKGLARRGSGSRRSPPTSSRSRRSFIRGRSSDLPSNTRGGSRMRELRSCGSVRGAAGNGRPYRERVSRVHTAMRNCTGDEGGPFGFGDQVADPKPPQAAAVKSRGGERCGNAGTMIPAGKVEGGERKRTAAEASKAD